MRTRHAGDNGTRKANPMSQTPTMVRSNGVDLATYVDGKEGRPWMVLMNSLAATARSWDAQVETLTRTHRLLRYDTRGHGRSATPPGPYSFDDLMGDTIGLMDQFGIARADLLGLSLGGMTALGLAIGHPGRVGRVICCDARADAPAPFVASWDTRVAAIRAAGGLSGILDGTLERWFTPAADPGVRQAAADMIRATDPEGYVACTAALKSLDFKRSLHAIRAPVLYLCGAQDQASPPTAMREMATLTPGAAYVEIDPGAHVCPMENPAQVNAAVRDWLARTPQPAP
jgi:3-oxoadipate enol-lactonase